ncbi:hypothetical protein PISMIDRAFT_359102 [Pisolithus microcarpus 441]|uniref:Uncharacterized protein n=1 Tax=Pisolithus microcarpus 441 TaxID=765257 RepID=A0A0C9YK56_9AGAM|nr:hypothetical protein PISMIDRAFT_359102 [Pisolithus microcarpus 441]
MYMKKGNCGRAVPLFERAKNLAPKDKKCPLLITISLIFGWSFDGLDVIAQQQRRCETLYAKGRTAEAAEILLSIIRISDKDTQESKANADWVAALGSAKHENAIIQYSAALSLSPPALTGLLIKRSKARGAKGLWEDALQDANEAVKADPSNP